MKTTTKAWIFTAALILFNIIYFWVRPEGRALTIVSDVLPIICALMAIIGMIFAVKSFKLYDRTKLAWILLLIGTIIFFCAESIYAVLEIILNIDVNEVFPTIADAFWLVGYAPFFVGLTLLVQGYRKSGFSLGPKKNYFFGVGTFVLITLLMTNQLFMPILEDAKTSNLSKFVYLYYPIADLLVIIPAMILVYITNLFGKARISRPWRYIAIGFLCMTTFDILYSYLSWNNMYGPGNFMDIFQNLSYLLIGLGGFYQKELIESV